jgi:DNA-binding NtrC family response regulator
MDHNLSLIKALVNTLQLEVETLDDDKAGLDSDVVDLAERVREYEAKLIKAALIKTGGNQRRAAKMLNLKTSTLNAKIKHHNIKVFRDPNVEEGLGRRILAAA